MKKYFLLVSALLLAIPTYASQFYAVVSAGNSDYEVDGDGESDNSFSIGGGYKFNKNFALEVAYRDSGELEFSDSDSAPNGDYFRETVTFGSTALEVSIVGLLPIGEAAALYGRLGVADVTLDAGYSYEERVAGQFYSESGSRSDSKNKALFGVGFSYSFIPALSARLEYTEYAEIENFTISNTTVGLVYQF